MVCSLLLFGRVELDDGVPFMAPGELDPLEDVAELLESLAAVALDRLHAAESVVVLLLVNDDNVL